MALLTVTLPACVPVDPVVMVTFPAVNPDPVNRLIISFTLTTASFAVGVKVHGADVLQEPPVVVPVLIVTFLCPQLASFTPSNPSTTNKAARLGVEGLKPTADSTAERSIPKRLDHEKAIWSGSSLNSTKKRCMVLNT